MNELHCLFYYLYLSLFYPLYLEMRLIRFFALSFALFIFLGAGFAGFSSEAFITGFESQEATLAATQKKSYYKKILANLSILAIRYRNDSQDAVVFN